MSALCCDKPTLQITVPACGSVSSTLVADVAGTYVFRYDYLGVCFEKSELYAAGQNIQIKGEWFNEGANVIGTVENPVGEIMSTVEGVKEITITVAKKVIL